MESLSTTLSTTLDANKTAAVVGAKIEAGRIILGRAKAALKATPGISGSAAEAALDSPFGEWALANVAQLVQKNFAPKNDKAEFVADSMLQASMVNGLGSLNLDTLISRVIGDLDLTKFGIGNSKEGV